MVAHGTTGPTRTSVATRGRLTLRDAPYYLFVGDETAAVPFAAILGALPPQVPVYGVLETDTPAGETPLPDSHQLPWIHRGAAAARSALLLKALGARDLPREPGFAYVAGEARRCQAIRDHPEWPVRSDEFEVISLRMATRWSGRRGSPTRR
jgi:NADPH-dependent ferric siderophore reductase